MDYREIIITALQTLRNNIMRTALTTIGIIIGITSVILIVSLGQGAVQFITNELSSFGTDYFQINPGKSDFSSTFAGVNTLTLADVEAIKNDTSMTNIKQVAPLAVTTSKVSGNDEEESITISGVTHEMLEILRPEIIYGEFITEENESTSERVAVLGSDVADTFFGEETDPVGERIRINSTPFRVIGVAKSESALAGSILNKSIYVPIELVFNQFLGGDTIQEIDVSVHNENQIKQTMEDVEALLRDRHNIKEGDDNDFRIASAQDILTTVQTITGLLTTMIAAISGISLVVGGVGVMNIMLVSVTERTKEIGLLKAIGAKEKDIMMQFLIESVVMTLCGGIIGIILGVGGAYLIAKGVNIPFVVSFPAILIAVGVSAGVGIAFGYYPARKAAKMQPIEALRYE
jgi:putative ABC transport system permease protein